MLSVILTLLKIIGILLLVLLLLLLLVVGLLLFVPFVYRAEGSCGKAEPKGRARVSWLFGLFLAEAACEKGAGPRVTVRAAGKVLFAVPKPRREKQEKQKKKKKKKADKKASEALKSPARGQSKPAPPPRKEKPAEASGEKPGRAPETETKKAAPPETFFSRLLKKIRALWAGLRGIPDRLRAFAEKLRNVKERLFGLKEKSEHYLEIWREPETQRAACEVKKHLAYLWRHFRPGKAAGRLRFGFADPSATGQAAGILYLLFSAPGCGIALEPVFETEETVLNGELSIRGHIRLCHAARTGLALFFNKDLRHLIKRLRNR